MLLFKFKTTTMNRTLTVLRRGFGLWSMILFVFFSTQSFGQISLSCPNDVSVTTSNGSNSAIVTWNAPTASTACTVDGTPDCSSISNYISGFVYMGEYNGSKYYCSTGTNFSWNAARNLSAAAGGYLVTIDNAAENEFVRSVIGSYDAWIGYTDVFSPGNFYWTGDDSNSNYENWKCWSWYSCEPSGGAQHYTRMLKSDGKWTDRESWYRAEFVMEIPCPASQSPGDVTLTQISGASSGSSFAIGTHTISYRATDDCGYTKTCNFTVTVNCANFTSGGTINGTQTICSGDDAALLGNVSLPTGGSGDAEYMWISQAGTSCPTDVNLVVPGANGPSYDPGVLTETTTFRRCARRAGCTTWSAESNCITITVDQSPGCGNIPASVGNFVWSDTNGNGIQDAGEPGLSGVFVVLANCVSNYATYTYTDANGAYSFTGLTPGQYKIEFRAPQNHTFSPKDAGFNDAIDSDAQDGFIDCFTLASGDNNTTIDAGFVPNASAVLTMTCNNDISVTAGSGQTSAQVSWTAPSASSTCTTGSVSVTQSAGPTSGSMFPIGTTTVTYNATDNCGNTETCSFTVTVTAGSGGNDPASVGDFVWSDTNGNGIQDAGEPGLGDVFVMLTDCAGNWKYKCKRCILFHKRDTRIIQN